MYLQKIGIAIINRLFTMKNYDNQYNKLNKYKYC